MTRPAWEGRRGFECSYCGRSLGIDRGAKGDLHPGDMIGVDHGWLIRDGRLEYRKPAHRGAGQGRTVLGIPTLPFEVVCRNRDCGETITIT